MAENSMNAATNAALANDLISQVVGKATEEPIEEAKITPPSDTRVVLPSGYITPAGEVIMTAEVRELNGKDEEAISKVTGLGRIFNTILSRGVVSIGNVEADDKVLDRLLTGDRDALLLGIYKATFGNPATLPAWCDGCDDTKEVSIDLNTDVTTKVLTDPVNDRTFTVTGRKHDYLVALPTGITQRELAQQDDKTVAELTTTLLEQTVLEIDGRPVVSKLQVQNIGVLDRRTIGEEISKRNAGPQFTDITITCPDCNGEVVVPFSLGALFRF